MYYRYLCRSKISPNMGAVSLTGVLGEIEAHLRGPEAPWSFRYATICLPSLFTVCHFCFVNGLLHEMPWTAIETACYLNNDDFSTGFRDGDRFGY
jgi:hypothetical protein